MRKQKAGAAMAAPLPHGCPLSSLHSPHHRNMKTECSYHKEDDPLLRSSIHALKDAMEVASLLLPLLSMGVETMESTPDDPQGQGKAAALWDRVRSGITALMLPMSPLPPPNPRLKGVQMKDHGVLGERPPLGFPVDGPKEGAAMAAPLPHGCPLSSLHSPHHRNMKTECSYHKEDDPLLRSSIHALKDAMEVASLLLPLLSMGVETMESTPDDPRRRGKAAALWDRVRSGITALMSPMSPLPPPNPRV
ncbi:hypothetical protein U9M48_035797 [Paspalum notatum var. saurae]|uniref:Uncharacterized protein n=2 Tax=Paspalum notatum var. saurae TaxID=547442 RepID=A0AAQ3X9D0_PASNO